MIMISGSMLGSILFLVLFSGFAVGVLVERKANDKLNEWKKELEDIREERNDGI